ncbi:hypothetical protein [Pseudoalteromonas prydzensis]|uniref:hypothetical protein n=1 Tax=Pseudoalteromonas prydzensis TaxID=182141 RepID=UPI0007E4DC61|nr:hypothetical protein [Pseudoalteromonas prydzensis]MBE0380406.1 hypothetical protein [Pseudoalteromonas prydzensis ACAM 620]
MNKIIITLSLLFSSVSYAESIGFGKVAGIKNYDFSNAKNIKVFLYSDATLINENCIEKQRVYGVITPNQHDSKVIDRMLSLITTAYVTNKKIRLHSETDSCEIDFVALQEDVF